MHAFPLIKRELAVAARRPITFWLRVAWGGGSMALATWAILVWGSWRAFSGAVLFYSLSALAEASVIITGFALAIDGISLERREGTLPLLFLTDLTAADILAGKLAATAATPFLTLLAVFPGLTICQLIGGLSPGELWRAMLALTISLFFTISAALLASTLNRQRYASAIFGALFLLVMNPALLLLFAARYQPFRYWAALTVYGVGTTALLWSSASILKRTWRREMSERMEGSPKPEQALRQASPQDDAPVAWMMQRRVRTIPAIRVVWGSALLLLSIYVGWELAHQSQVPMVLTLLFLGHAGILVSLLSQTAYSFHADKQEGTLEVLLSTPLANEDIFAGLARFLHRRAARLLLVVTAADGLFSLLLWPSRLLPYAVFPLTMAAILWITFYGVRWLGVYRSLMLNTPLISILTTLWRIAFFPTILSAVFLMAPGTDYLKVCVFWLVSAGFLSLFFGNDARRVLMERGRELLIRPACDKPPHIESEWSFINWESIQEPRTELAASE